NPEAERSRGHFDLLAKKRIYRLIILLVKIIKSRYLIFIQAQIFFRLRSSKGFPRFNSCSGRIA
ncbi:hypothetical protein, partial [Algoriphagus sp.]|uniref:hypothetical protein n=1 Tax=Algoriphagus sp. TaxID=1872435 RepID=UPI0039198F47